MVLGAIGCGCIYIWKRVHGLVIHITFWIFLGSGKILEMYDYRCRTILSVPKMGLTSDEKLFFYKSRSWERLLQQFAPLESI